MTHQCPECGSTHSTVQHAHRLELGHVIPYRFHTCDQCGQVQSTFEDLQWNKARVEEFDAEVERQRKLPWQAKLAYAYAWVWCCVASSVGKEFYFRTISRDSAGIPVLVTATTDEHRIVKVFWTAK